MVTRMDFLGERLIKAELGENPQIRKRIQDVVKEEVKVALEEREEIEKRALNLLVVNIIIIFHTVQDTFSVYCVPGSTPVPQNPMNVMVMVMVKLILNATSPYPSPLHPRPSPLTPFPHPSYPRPPPCPPPPPPPPPPLGLGMAWTWLGLGPRLGLGLASRNV